MASQLECKRRVDSKFKDNGHPRFKQVQIDLKYHSLSLSIDAVKTGDLNLLTESLPHVDVRMAVSLTLVAIERDHIHLMGCLLEKLVHERAFEVRNDKSVEPPLYIGLDAAPYSACSPRHKPSADAVDIVNRSRVLCLLKILYHKYIFLDVNWIFDLVQTLLFEELYVENEQLIPERELLLRERERVERERVERERYFMFFIISLVFIFISYYWKNI